MKNWFAVHTRSRHEFLVEEQLLAKGFSPFLPQIKAWSRRKDRQKQFIKSLFPGYLFIEMEPEREGLLAVLKTRGVVRFLGNGNEPAIVPRYQVESIHILLGSQRALEPYQYLNIGDQVQIATGPLRGAIGILQKVNEKKKRLIVCVDLFQQGVVVDLGAEDVEKLVA